MLFFDNPIMNDDDFSALRSQHFKDKIGADEKVISQGSCRDDLPLHKIYGHFMTFHPAFGYALNPIKECNNGFIGSHAFAAPEFEEGGGFIKWQSQEALLQHSVKGIMETPLGCK